MPRSLSLFELEIPRASICAVWRTEENRVGTQEQIGILSHRPEKNQSQHLT